MFKKIISSILAVAMVAAMSTTVFAEAIEVSETECDNGVSVQLDAEDTLNPNDFKESNDALVELGKMATRKRAASVVRINKYYQGGESWSNDLMKTMNLPIGTHGCTVSSFAMMLGYYGYNVNPGQVNATLGAYACDFQYGAAANKYNLRINNYERDGITRSYAVNFIVGAIDSSMPVLVGMTNSSGGTHFVAAYGFATDSINLALEPTISIKDPTRSKNYTTLSQYLNAGWTVHRLYAFE